MMKEKDMSLPILPQVIFLLTYQTIDILWLGIHILNLIIKPILFPVIKMGFLMILDKMKEWVAFFLLIYLNNVI